MLSGFKAKADLRGYRIDLSWAWAGAGARQLRLLRKRRAYPRHAEDGLCVLDLQDPFWTLARTEGCIERLLYLGANMLPESGLRHAELVFHFGSPEPVDAEPVLVTVRWGQGSRLVAPFLVTNR